MKTSRGFGDQIARDLQPLAHAAGEGARLVVDPVLIDLDPAEPVDRGSADIAVMPVPDRHQPLADIGAGRDRHPQAVDRVLVHEAPVGAHQITPLGLRHLVDVAACTIAHPVVNRAAGRRQPRGNAIEQRRLAGAGFADDRQHLARPEVETDIRAADPVAVDPGDAVDD
jgi:hypothetical protein